MQLQLDRFRTRIVCENEEKDTVVETEVRGNTLEVAVRALQDKLKFIELEWDFACTGPAHVLGDAWERTYGDVTFRKIADQQNTMPWYFMVAQTTSCTGFGVKTQPNAFVGFTCTNGVIKAVLDCRNGGSGVELNGRRLHLATFVLETYESSDAFDCLCDFCKKLCDHPILPKEKIYGGNNWYYAYGKSSYEQIVSDAKFQAELAKGIDNKPFEVVDDCWQLHSCAGPWLPNDQFGDMKKLADDIRAAGARPGLWVRLLRSHDSAITEDMRILRGGERQYLDPTHPAVQKYIREDVRRVKNWGYELMKHDFTTADLFGDFGKDLNDTITNYEDWHFYDRCKTNAEIALDLYRLIREEAGEMYIIGCNTVSHLCAGLVEINRIGDDTSGREWDRTVKMGVNTLAFRLAQNEAFYMVDADCVGILKDCIPWEKNRQWLHVLARSNSPLFVSCTNQITQEQKEDLTAAYKVYHEDHTIRPLDIFENVTPSRWKIDGETVEYSW